MSHPGSPPETASAWPLPPAHYRKANELEPPKLPPKDAASALPGEVPDPDFYKEQVYDVPLDFHYSQQFESISEIISNLVPSEHLQHPKTALKFVNEAILVAFIRLVNSLATNPTQPAEGHLENLNQYVMIFHQLLNAYRPHQARQMAISLLQAQCERRKKFLEKLKVLFAFNRFYSLCLINCLYDKQCSKSGFISSISQPFIVSTLLFVSIFMCWMPFIFQ